MLAGVSVEVGDGAERVTPVGDASDGSGARAVRGEIEAPYLQLVMSTLWEHECAHGSHVLRRSTLAELGGAKEIIRTHLDGELDALAPETTTRHSPCSGIS